jgi:glutamine cyclotransferase
LILVAILLTIPIRAENSQSKTIPRLRVKVEAEYPHDPTSFTQGLVWHEGRLFESLGQYGSSSLREVDLASGTVLQEASLPVFFFGEGLVCFKDRLIQLTWREGVAFVYDLSSLEEIARMRYEGQGWGLCSDGTWLIMSDGSQFLTFRDPESMAFWKKVPVTMRGQPVHHLNELEWVDGSVFANVWQRTELLKIDPGSGRVIATIDASGLPYKPSRPGEDVLNGIAYIPERQTFLLTGKLWPKIYEVRFE